MSSDTNVWEYVRSCGIGGPIHIALTPITDSVVTLCGIVIVDPTIPPGEPYTGIIDKPKCEVCESIVDNVIITTCDIQVHDDRIVVVEDNEVKVYARKGI